MNIQKTILKLILKWTKKKKKGKCKLHPQFCLALSQKINGSRTKKGYGSRDSRGGILVASSWQKECDAMTRLYA